jgi:hypothetical protein
VVAGAARDSVTDRGHAGGVAYRPRCRLCADGWTSRRRRYERLPRKAENVEEPADASHPTPLSGLSVDINKRIESERPKPTVVWS